MKKIACFIGIGFGILAIILSMAIGGMTIGYTESDKSYGGDAYTGMQNASAQAANNARYGNDIERTGAANILLIMGGLSIAYFLKEMPEGTFKKKEKPVAAPQWAPAPGFNPAPQQPFQVPPYQAPQQPAPQQPAPQNNPYNVPPQNP